MDNGQAWKAFQRFLALVMPEDKAEQVWKALSERYHSPMEVFYSRIEELQRIPGITLNTAILIRLVRSCALSCTKEVIHGADASEKTSSVICYLRLHLDNREREYFMLLTLDKENRVRSGEIIAEGSIDKVYVNSRELFANALHFQAERIILVHNHPGGSPVPSAEDWEFTEAIQKMAASFGIEVVDHVIVTHNGIFSFAAACEITLEEENLFRFGSRKLIIPHGGIPFTTTKIRLTHIKNMADLVGEPEAPK